MKIELSIVLVYLSGRKEQLKRGLNSLCMQNVDYRKIELLFLNIGNELEALNILKEYSNKLSIKYYSIKENDSLFLASHRNFLFKQSQGNYLMITDPEIVHYTNTLQQALDAPNKYGKNIWYFGKTFGTRGMLDKQGKFSTTEMSKDVNENIFDLIGKEPTRSSLIDLSFFKNNDSYIEMEKRSHPYPPWCAIVNKEMIFRIHGYNEDMTKWGFDDIDIGQRLKQIGIKKVYDKYMIVYHLPHKKLLSPEERKCWVIYNASIPFNKKNNWGNLKQTSIIEKLYL